MNKQEFLNLSGFEQLKIMSRLTKAKVIDRDKVSQLKEWFKETLEEKHGVVPTSYGLMGIKQASDMGYNLDEEAYEAEEYTGPRTNNDERKNLHYCPKANSHIRFQQALNAKARSYSEPTTIKYEKANKEQDSFL